jgi:hypothetical protein
MSKLSVEKFMSYVATNKFTVSGVYMVKNTVRFFEMKTPNTRKTFFIFIPENYVLTNSDVLPLDGVKFVISPKEYALNENMLKYVNSTLTNDFDIVSISSTMICYIPSMDPNTVRMYSFKLGDNDYSSSESSSSSDGEDTEKASTGNKPAKKDKFASQIEQLVKESGLPESEFASSSDGEMEEKTSDVDSLEVSVESDKDINIPKDEPGGTPTEIDIDEPEEITKTGGETTESVKVKKILNDIPLHIEEQQIRLGLIYYCCSISQFVQKISTVEAEVEKCLKQTDEVRKDEWEKGIDKIKTRVVSLQERLLSKVDGLIKTYFDMQNNIRKLSVLYIKSFDGVDDPIKKQFRDKSKATLEEAGITLIHARNDIENELEKVNSLLDEIEN